MGFTTVFIGGTSLEEGQVFFYGFRKITPSRIHQITMRERERARERGDPLLNSDSPLRYTERRSLKGRFTLQG